MNNETMCLHCLVKHATWCEILCSDCASLTAVEIEQYKRTGTHPRVPVRIKVAV